MPLSREESNARKNARRREKRKNDPEWGKAMDALSLEWQRKKRKTDPEWREAANVKGREWSRKHSKKIAKRKAMNHLIELRARPPKTGHIYLFESVTPGWCKLGCTKQTLIKKRLEHYQGPSKPKRFFVKRRSKHIQYDEHVMKMFFRAHGLMDNSVCEWFRLPS